jgi:hypothetical protein
MKELWKESRPFIVYWSIGLYAYYAILDSTITLTKLTANVVSFSFFLLPYLLNVLSTHEQRKSAERKEKTDRGERVIELLEQLVKTSYSSHDRF